MIESINLMKALSDEGRVRVLAALTMGELCICQIIDLLKLAPSTVSKHLSILQQVGLIQTRKDGKWIFVKINREGAANPANTLLKALICATRDDPQLIKDRVALVDLKKKDLSVLCKNRQRKRRTR